MALANELLHTFGQARRALFDLGPEDIAPEGILAYSGFQGCQPAAKARASTSQLGGDGNKADRGFGVEDMVDDAGGAPRGEVPVVLFDQDAMEPGEGTPSLAPKGALGLGTLGTRQGASGNALGLVVDQEQRDEESMDDIAVQAERVLLGRGAFLAVGGTEAGFLRAALLSVQLVTHGSEGLVALQLELVAM